MSGDLVSKFNEDPKLIGCHEYCIEDQYPHCMNQLLFAVSDCFI